MDFSNYNRCAFILLVLVLGTSITLNAQFTAGYGTIDEYLVGDWDGDGTDNLASRVGNKIYMTTNHDQSSDIIQVYGRGNREDQYLVGDWDGDGRDNIAVRRGDQIIMDYNFDGRSDKTQAYGLGNHEDEYLVGDWDGDGRDNIAVRRGAQVLMDTDFNNVHNVSQTYGDGKDQYMVGDWNGDGIDDLAYVERNRVHLSHGFTSSAETVRGYGDRKFIDEYLAGDWDGDGKDNYAVRSKDLFLMDYDFDGRHDKAVRYSVGDMNKLAKGVYFIGNKLTDRVLWINQANELVTSGHGDQDSRLVFEPAGSPGKFYLRVSQRDRYLFSTPSFISFVTVAGSVKMEPHWKNPTSSVFELAYQNDGSYTIKSQGQFLFEDPNTNKINLSANPPNPASARFRLLPKPRKVRFAATGDPQLDNRGLRGSTKQSYLATRAVLDRFASYNYGGSIHDYRGVVISGDLTQNTRADEFREYKRLTKSYKSYVYEGLGNHDLGQGHCCLGIGTAYCICPDQIADYVARRRANWKVGQTGTHYSWNWEDVHFVQLNLYPGDKEGKTSKWGGVTYKLNPHKSLSFLKEDLAKQVGTSGRPVVLIHHYGFDEMSEADWSASEKLAYWNVIADYNVAAIITGHLHNPSDTTFDPLFRRPSGASRGPKSIPTFIAGGAVEYGYFLDLKIEGNELTIRRNRASGTRPPFNYAFETEKKVRL